MIENPMVMHNGYGIKDPQEYEPIPVEDECGTEVFAGDRILVSPEGDFILKENATEYLRSKRGFEERTAGERDEFTTKD